MLGIDRVTLQRWLLSGKVREPRRIKNGGIDARVWTARDVERVNKYKAAHYWEGTGSQDAEDWRCFSSSVVCPRYCAGSQATAEDQGRQEKEKEEIGRRDAPV